MKKPMKATVSVLLALCISTAFGSSYYLKSGEADWSRISSYCSDAARTLPMPGGTALPGAADTIYVPSGNHCLVSGTASFATFAGAGRVAPETSDCIIELQVNEGTADSPVVVNAAVYHDNQTDADCLVGTVVKSGSGFLELTAKDSVTTPSLGHTEYGVNVDVQAGALRLGRDDSNATYHGSLSVAAGAAVWLPQSTGGSQAYFHWIKAEEGSLITNATARADGHILGARACGGKYDVESYIKGAIGGGVRIWTTGSVRIESTENTIAQATTVAGNNGLGYRTAARQCRGAVLAAKVGKTGEPSSIGSAGNILLGYGGTGGVLRYLGHGDETDKQLSLYGGAGDDSTACQNFIDGGPYGGLWLQGMLMPVKDNSAPAGVRRLWLTGENAEQECVVDGGMGRLVVNNVTYPVHLTKTGSGTWRLTDKDRNHVGGTTIADGVLKFDSLAEKGEMCSLGLSTVLTPDDSRAVENGNFVDYAFTLGSLELAANPVFEYSGSAIAACSTRPLVLAGQGGTLRASAGVLDFAGVSARDADSSPTLTLDGTTVGHVVRDITDGASHAAVNVVKDGAGTWTLGGWQTFSGKLTVKQGTLAVDVPHPIDWPYQSYKWFRLSIAQIDGGSSSTIKIRQIGLYDKDGVRQNVGLALAEPAAGKGETHTVVGTVPMAGQVGYDASAAGLKLTVGNSDCGQISACFSETGYGGSDGICEFTWKDGSGNNLNPSAGNRATWIPIVMHLADSAHEVTHFDVQTFYKTSQPRRIVLEASLDGYHWSPVYSNTTGDTIAEVGGYNRWLSDNTEAGNAEGKHDRPYSETSPFIVPTSGEKKIDYFKWYRLSIAEIGGGAKSDLKIRQIGLYDKDGVRQNVGLTLAETAAAPGGQRKVVGTVPGVGEVGYDVSAAGHYLRTDSKDCGELAACFLEDGYGGNNGICAFTWQNGSGGALSPVKGDAATWIPIVMHLQPWANPVTHFDVQFYQAGYHPTRIKLEGSADGTNWYVVYSNVDGVPVGERTGYNKWISDNVEASNTSHSRLAGTGFLAQYDHQPDPEPKDQLTNVTEVQILADSVLQSNLPLSISKLTVDTTDAGTISGFSFAETGVIKILNRKPGRLPMSFVSCEGLENIAQWNVVVDGRATDRYKIIIKDGAAWLQPPGFVVVVR